LIFISAFSIILSDNHSPNTKTTAPEHIKDILDRNFPPITEHSLWRRYKDLNELKNYRRVPWSGIHNNHWIPTFADRDIKYNHIASPVPFVEPRRVVANEIPIPTISKSATYDLPKRSEVSRLDIPQSTMKTVEYVLDPNNKMKPIKGNLYHGIVSGPQRFSSYGYRFKNENKEKVDPHAVLEAKK